MATKTRRLLPVLPKLDLSDMGALSTLNGVATTTKLRRALGDVSVELTMDGASVLSLPIIDPDLSILRAHELLGDRVELDLGERFVGFRRWRMYRPNRIGGFSLDGTTTALKFWDLGAAALKGQTGALRKSHSLGIEALVNLLAREASAATGFDLTVVAPRPGETLPTTDIDGGSVGDYGFSQDSSKNVTLGGHPATTEQLKNINIELQTAVEEKASARAALALVLACIVEPAGYKGSGPFDNPAGGDADSAGILQVRGATVAAMRRRGIDIDNRDPAACGRVFLNVGFWGKGGAIKIARENPTQTAGWIAQQVQGSAYPRRYDEHHAEGVQIIEQWSGKTLALWHTVTGAAHDSKKAKAARPAEWRRGTATKAESSWAMLDRYSQQLGRRRFTCGNRLVVARDQDLILATPHQTITPTDAALTERIAIDDNMAAGVQTIDLTVLRDAWITPPGGVAEVAEAGVANGPWLVETVTATASQPTLSVTLTQPVTEVPKKATRKPAKKTKSAELDALLNDGKRGHVEFPDGVNKPGQPVTFETTRYVELVAGIYGKPLIVSCGTNHKKYASSGLISDHSTGHAVDLGMVLNRGTNDGPVGDAIATAALMAAGWPQAKAVRSAQAGGLFTIVHAGLRIQVIWKAPDHHDHVHVGARPA
jgi:hypothetical protein